jgi:hypothetical protein
MKKVKYLVAAAILCGICAVSFYVGRNYEYQHFGKKDYEAACLEADFIRNTFDHFKGVKELSDAGSEIEEHYYEYFTDIENYGTSLKDVKEFEQYSWCY